MLLPDKDIVALAVINRRITAWRNEQAYSYGLTSSQVPIIILACKMPGISQNQVVEEVGLEKSVIAKTIGKLMARGYLTRTQNAKDRRAFDLFPTDKAMAVYPALVTQGRACMDQLTVNFSLEEKALLSDLLQRMVDNAAAHSPDPQKRF